LTKFCAFETVKANPDRNFCQCQCHPTTNPSGSCKDLQGFGCKDSQNLLPLNAARVEAPKTPARGEVWGGGVLFPNGEEFGERAMYSSRIFFIVELKMVRFSALWVLFLQFGCLFYTQNYWPDGT